MNWELNQILRGVVYDKAVYAININKLLFAHINNGKVRLTFDNGIEQEIEISYEGAMELLGLKVIDKT